MDVSKFISIAILSTLVLVSCTKEEEADPTEKDKKTLLVSSDWMMTNQVASPPFDTLDIWITVDDCIKDNSYSFSSNGNGLMDEKAKLCEPSDEQFVPFIWSLENNENDLQWVMNDDTTLIKDVVITADSFYGKEVSIFFDYITVTYRAN